MHLLSRGTILSSLVAFQLSDLVSPIGLYSDRYRATRNPDGASGKGVYSQPLNPLSSTAKDPTPGSCVSIRQAVYWTQLIQNNQ